ncbi:MAG: ATP-binding protein [Deltaproteobacteria bacterium]|nr:ATP-binding protein [Deltaproteobacteria bacterium]
MDRIQSKSILEDLEEKMVFLTGPRQVGKTTLAKSFSHPWSHLVYLNFDSFRDRRVIMKEEWDRKAPLVIFDEIHKFKKWKTKLKGVYDTEGIPPRILVTGSARLDIYRRGGDSLAGRYFKHRLYPFSVRELKGQASAAENLEALLKFGGFPEPLLAQSERKATRWRKQHVERILREDVQDLEPVKDIRLLLLLIDLLRERVGSPISYSSLARELEISPHTVKRWIEILENMYIVFRVTPYHRSLSRALLKEPKLYFYDNAMVEGTDDIRLENLVANCLLKYLHYLEDHEGVDVQLHYIRDKEKREVDFLCQINRQLKYLIEVKSSDSSLSPSLHYYHQRLPVDQSIQLVKKLGRAKTVKGIQVTHAADWLESLDI